MDRKKDDDMNKSNLMKNNQPWSSEDLSKTGEYELPDHVRDKVREYGKETDGDFYGRGTGEEKRKKDKKNDDGDPKELDFGKGEDKELAIKPAPEGSRNRETYKKNVKSKMKKSVDDTLDKIKEKLEKAKSDLLAKSSHNHQAEMARQDQRLSQGSSSSQNEEGDMPEIEHGVSKGEDKEKMKEIAEQKAEKKIKEHEDDKHGVKGHKKEHEKLKVAKNGQWSLDKAGDMMMEGGAATNATDVNCA